ncbi:unnamed protein product [Adineta steineri]|uniref:DUF5648 domain-containing protein n=1 Tax=Adineta steineri TaxID=433720 RepID=A0A818KS66_9BILA|nr:unnamed protein product [Adineta steineri]CAF3555674.1 unnamed protein product [Adineta steineri]
MRFLLFVNVFAIILQNSLSSQPGDPFPIDEVELKRPSSEDLINNIEVVHSNNVFELTTDHMNFNVDKKKPIDNVISTITKSTPILLNRNNGVEIKINFNKNPITFTENSITVPELPHKIIDHNDDFEEKPTFLPETSIASVIKSNNKTNLIKIGRWKHEDLQTKTIRYWYETENGHMGDGWTFDKYIFQAYDKTQLNTQPVYSFHSEIRSIWTNTIQMDPKPPVIGNDQWIPDGVSFYAYKTLINSTELQPVVRYWNRLKPGATDLTETRISYLTTDDVNVDQLEWIRTLSVSPGDPFPTNFNKTSSSPVVPDSKDIHNKTTAVFIYSSSSFKPNSSDKSLLESKSFVVNVTQTFINKNEDNNTSFTSTIKSVQDTFPIYKKHLVQIAQSKYTDPKTQQTRYWYHTIDTLIGADWTFDRILCQAYIRQKPNTIPIHAFHSNTKDIWTNTLQIESTPLPIGNNQWKYDGIPFYAYKTSTNSTLLKPVWLYWNRINYGTEDVSQPRRSYFLMSDIADDNLPEWKLDRILFYAFPPNMNVTQSDK